MTSPDDLDASHAQSGAVPELVPKCLHGAYAVAQRHLPFLDPDYTPPTSWIKTHKAVAALGVIYTLLSGAARAVRPMAAKVTMIGFMTFSCEVPSPRRTPARKQGCPTLQRAAAPPWGPRTPG